jgi:hypothetical protein
LGFGLGFGGTNGPGTIVTASSTLSAGFVSRPPPPVTVATFVCVPTAVARAVTLIVAVSPAARLPRLQVMSDADRLHVPFDGLAVKYVMPEGAGSASWTIVAVSGPLFWTVIV